MLRSISKQSRESRQSVLKKKRRLRWKGFAEKERFQSEMKTDGGDGILSMNVSGIKTV